MRNLNIFTKALKPLGSDTSSDKGVKNAMETSDLSGQDVTSYSRGGFHGQVYQLFSIYAIPL